MKLIVTEKDNAARRIADILSDGTASTERERGVNVYRWGGTRVVGLSGHVVGLDFPDEYSDWRDVEPVELIDADVRKEPTQENIVAVLQSLAREADRAVIATDYDREGELIGKEAYELVREVDEEMPIDRVRFSSITENEVQAAFDDPDELDFDLAAAGEARQLVDLMWGASLTRFLSLSAGQLGDDFISVGRVQSPTLKILVDREREIEAFEPDDYWELFADLAKNSAEQSSSDPREADASRDSDTFEAQYVYEDDDGTQAERVWAEEAADAAYETLSGASAATVESVSRRTRTDEPPAPFNTTQFIRAAGSLGYNAGRAMSMAEDLYTEGYITYPRTDNTVYPEDLDPDDLLDEFVAHPTFGDDAESLLAVDVDPTEGDEETTDHPPIHPTGEIPDRSDLSEEEWELYELVVRRFFATVAEDAEWEHLRVVATVDGLSLKANGKRLLEPGYHDVYPYFSTSENYVPDVEEGEELALTGARIEEKQTQPPRRYGQSRLIERMEDLGLGTKCLTEDVRVLVRSSDGDIERRSVADLFEEDQVVLADGDADVATTEDGPRTISYAESDDKIAERESRLVSKRPLETDEQVFEIETESGTLSVTEDHPLYVRDGDRVVLVPARTVTSGDELLTARAPPKVPNTPSDSPVVLTWAEFAADCDWSTKLFGVDCNDALATAREQAGETQAEFADRIGTRQNYISLYENDERDVPAWILGELDICPDELHGLNHGTTFTNPFPLKWSETLARVLGNLLGDGSIHINDEENVVDVRYHNTDRRLVDRFVNDIEALFDVQPPVNERQGRKSHHKRKYQVDVPSAIGRILVRVLDSVTSTGCPSVPEPYQPAFVGALFDDEGHVSRERKAFISNVDHELLAGVAEMLEGFGIETKLARNQHKLHIRGRKNLERFFDTVPIATDEKFYRGVDALRRYEVTMHKAHLLNAVRDEPSTSAELATRLGLTRGRINDLVRALRDEGHVEKRVEGSNRSRDGNRTIRYVATGFEESIFSTLLGHPSASTVLQVREREYDGAVYDLTVDDETPNFAVEGGVIVHNSTRHETIEKLYDRGYVEGDPPRPTKLARAVVEAAEDYADHVVSESMTRQLEEDMQAIADGDATLDEVTEESREMLKRVFDDLTDSREAVGDQLRESLKADKTLGPCPECGEDLLVRQSNRGSYFVGCDGYPDCTFTLPLPNTGKPLVLDETCDDHDLKEVKMLAGRQTFTHGCPRCKAEEADEQEDRVIGECPDCGSEHGGELAIKHLRNGSRLVGCTRYPDCEYSVPLPRRGDVEVTDATCDEHGLPELVVIDGDDPWDLGCPICNYREYQARESDSGTDLESLDGVGEATAEKLVEAGVESISDLKDADPEGVADSVDGVSEERVREWQAKA